VLGLTCGSKLMNPTSRGRVLAVDDKPANLVALDAVLGDKYELIRANSGPEAIATLERDSNIDEAFTAHLGRPGSVWAIATVAGSWIAANLALPVLGMKPLEPPPFEWMQCACSLGALLMATAVLAAQNRQRHVSEEHAQLDLHINLLAEQKVAKIVSLLEELRRDMPNVSNREDAVAEAMTHAVDPHVVANALKETVEVEVAAEDDDSRT
jgi:uncharacterized membrane protein